MNEKVTRLACSLMTAGLLVGLYGCEGAGFGSKLAQRPKQAVRITTPESTTFRVPHDEPFSIDLPSSSQQAGLNGTAKADANVGAAEGTASASAQVTRSGSAEGLFQIGHALDNATDRLFDLHFKVSFEYEFSAREEVLEGSEEIGAPNLPDAQVGLTLYVQKGRNEALAEMSLVDHTTEAGNVEQNARISRSFTVTVGPRTQVNFFLAGQAKIDIPERRTTPVDAAASLSLRDVSFEVTADPVPGARAATDEQR
jgi:hypothetical protein